jgi:hypothetical protein
VLALDQGAQGLDAADVQRGVRGGDEQPLGHGHIELRVGRDTMPVLVAERSDVGVALAADVADPFIDALQRVDRVANLLGRAPVGAKDLVLQGDDLPRETSQEAADVCALAVGDVPDVPEHAQAIRMWRPVELLLAQAADLPQRVGIPETLVVTHVAVHELGQVVPV